MSAPQSQTDLVLNAALELLDQGFSVIPVGRNKKPLFAWKEFQARCPSEDELLSWWTQHPQANLALITGSVSGVWVVDADGPKGSEWISKNLPRTSVYAKTAKGLHAYFKIPDKVQVQNMVRLAPEVDVRGEGGYVVVPPSIHDTGVIYEWEFSEGFDGWEDLTEIAPPGAEVPKKAGNLQLDLSHVQLPPSVDPVQEGERNNALTKLVGRWIAKDLDYDEVSLFAKSWNAQNTPPLPELELKRTVKSVWELHQKNHPETKATDAYVPDREEAIVPPEVLQPGGLLQDIMDFIERSSAASFPLFNLGAAITTLGSLVGQKVMTETGLRTNFYVISLGYSGSGKDGPLSGVENLLLQAGAHDLLGAKHLTSAPAILKDLETRPRQLMLLDELGDLVRGLKDISSHKAEIPRYFKSLFSSTDRSEYKNYADGKAIIVKWHHFSFYGTSTPESFWENLTYGDVTGGFLARTLILESGHEAPIPKVPDFQIPEELVKAIKDLHQLSPLTDGNIGRPIPYLISKTSEASEWFEAWALKHHELKNKHRKDPRGISAVYGRAAEHAHKLALVHHLSKTGVHFQDTQVELDSVMWAANFVNFVATWMIKQVSENIIENEVEKWRQKIIKTIERKANKINPGLTRRQLGRYIRGLTSKNMDTILGTMRDSGEIIELHRKAKNGRDVVLYCLTKKGSEAEE